MYDLDLFIIMFTGIWCLVGGVFLAVGFGLRRSLLRRDERQRARSTGRIAEVVRRVSRGSDGESVSWHPVVEFEADGRRISLESDEGGGRKRFYEGQPVEVLYDPDDPSSFHLEGRSIGALMSRIFLAVGFGCIVIGLIAALLAKGIGQRFIANMQ